ncbi:ATP-binding protein [Plantactinospora sp. B5E13]|uniref:ATP-binding protein n=1 Tax=unclassified Plantactinospora TaxID=2631981 RepID=UPI00325CB09B
MAPLSSSGRSAPGGLPVWSAAVLLTVATGTAAVLAGVSGDGQAGIWAAGCAAGGTVLTLLLLGVLHRRQRAAWQAVAEREQEAERRLQDQQRELAEQETGWRELVEARSAAANEALENLTRVRLPKLLAGTAVPPAPVDTTLDDTTAALLEELLTELTGGLKRTDEREESLRLAVVALARRVQTAAHSIQEQVSLLADRHQHDPDVVESTMRVDHAAAQQARHAQSLAVLCGEWPGQQWQEPLAMVDVVRAASARILAYQRVEVSGDQDVAVAAEVVEPVIHLVAELLANATQSSPPSTQVPVTVRRVQRGAVIEIDDGGVGMDEHRLQQAREIVSGRRTVGLGELGEIPQTGLAVVGHYVRRHNFRADLSESPYGGLRAVVLIPAKSVETVESPEALAVRPPAARQPESVEVTPAAGAGTPSGSRQDADAAALPPTREGLPRRRSRRGEAAGAVAGTESDALTDDDVEPAAAPAPTPEQAGAWMSAFIKGGRTDDGTDPAGSTSTSTTVEDEQG